MGTDNESIDWYSLNKRSICNIEGLNNKKIGFPFSMLPTPPPDPKSFSHLDPTSSETIADIYLEQVIGAAVFDLNGLPKQFFITPENPSLIWTQTILQILGLKSLLNPLMPAETFHYVTFSGHQYRALVVNRRSLYLALAIKHHEDEISHEFIRWAWQVQLETFQKNPRFQAR
jgi:hypothetical protein